MAHTMFLEGPAGTGKTSFAIQHIRGLLDRGVPAEQIVLLLPQRTLGLPYQIAFTAPDWPGGAQVDMVTLGGLARRGLETFWPLVASKAGFTHPEWEPAFLTIETAQYFMAGFVQAAVHEGVFDSISITPFRIMSQTLDNLSKAAINRFTLDEVAERLVTSWGERHSSRPPVYRASVELARQFRAHCLQYSLLDFSLQVELYMSYLLDEPLYASYFKSRYRHLVADNLEESFPIVADFIRWLWDDLESALLVYDTEAGYRVFLGADPAGMYQLSELCDEVVSWSEPLDSSPSLTCLAAALDTLVTSTTLAANLPANPRLGFTHRSHRFYPDMITDVADQVVGLVSQGVPPREIVILAPFLGDSLRFVLTTQLAERGVSVISHRPSRAVRDEPAARAVLTLTALAHPDWQQFPPLADVADAFQQVIEGLDPVRAWLLAQVVYRPNQGVLGSFDVIRPEMQERITFVAGQRYEYLRNWLDEYRLNVAGTIPPDHFISRLFGEVLSQPGYGFHTDLLAGRVVAELVESARKFRQAIHPKGTDDWLDVSSRYFSLVQEGLLAALYVASWHEEQQDAVFLAPAYTFLMRNRRVDYQFWLDVGSSYWWERLEQPLTHPYVLSRGYPADQVWTDELEFAARRDALRRLLVGLIRRCRKHIYAAVANLGEQGYEQRGPLLQIVQQLVQHYPDPQEV